MSEPLLELEGFGVAFGERMVLAEVNLSLPSRGMTVLVGPAGVGKSTLLRTLSGANDGNPSLRVFGKARFAGEPLGAGERPGLVAQRAQLLMGTVLENMVSAMPDRSQLTRAEQIARVMELFGRAGTGLSALGDALSTRVIELPAGLQRRLSIARTTAAEPRLLCVDEPTSGLDDAEALAMLAQLRGEAARRAVLFVTHHQGHARIAGGTVALLAGGRIFEHVASEMFFSSPQTAPAKQFVRTGSCFVPSPGASAEELDETLAPVPTLPAPLPAPRQAISAAASGPNGFRWIKRGALGGTPRPGLLQEIGHDLDALHRIGVTVLVTLEREPLRGAELASFGLRGLLFPIDDMRAPEIPAAIAHCAEVARLLATGEVVAQHCFAGLGRTGTMLAAQLIYEGSGALDALTAARRVEPRWVQSTEQIQFLEDLEGALARGAARPQPSYA